MAVKTHELWFKATADRVARDYRLMGWTVRLWIRPKNQGYTLKAFKS